MNMKQGESYIEGVCREREYIGHKEGERIQTLKDHLEGTARLSEMFAGQFGKSDWGYCCGLLHDIGKYSVEFQRKIWDGGSQHVDHATAGAKVCADKAGLYRYMSYCIAGHHAGLPDTGSPLDAEGATLEARMRKKIPDYQACWTEIKVPAITTLPFDERTAQNPWFSMSVFIRMLYSCLVDADFLDTESFMKNGKIERQPGEPMEDLLKKLEMYVADWLSNSDPDTINGRRTEILKHCLEQGAMKPGMFRLTVPTGGGKTVASLAFALRHAVENGMNRIIYVIPYTSIIEQNAEVFRRILGDQNVLENHYNVDYADSDELRPMQLAAENWDKPVVVTTNVQFFESLFANKSSRCRKLHNIAGSVIIFDEAQMLPNDYLKPCTAMMEELAANYRSTVVLCTATQPALSSFFPDSRKSAELCPRMEEQFRFFKRTVFQNIGRVSEEDLIERLSGEYQTLCIVNTRKRAQALYRRLKGDGVYHLSTTMYPAHRRRILEEIRKRLKMGEKCIVTSTSLVEAGVDLDFHSVYRQLAGVDSMIQAAGRCNREGKRGADESTVRIFRFEEKENIPAQKQQIDVAEILLTEGWELSSLECVEEYFKRLYHFRGEGLDKKKIMDEFSNRGYNFAKVGKEFRLIEEHTKTIFVNREEASKMLLLQLKHQGYTRAAMRKAGQYSIQLYDQDFAALYGAGMIQPVIEELEDFYELVDGEAYTEEMGLRLDVESGMALFL